MKVGAELVRCFTRTQSHSRFLVVGLIYDEHQGEFTVTTQKTGGGGGGVLLTSYTCDTLFCSRKEGRQSRLHRKKDEGLGDRNDQRQAGFTDSLN